MTKIYTKVIIDGAIKYVLSMKAKLYLPSLYQNINKLSIDFSSLDKRSSQNWIIDPSPYYKVSETINIRIVKITILIKMINCNKNMKIDIEEAK